MSRSRIQALYTPDLNNHLDNSFMVDNKYFTGKRRFDNITMIFRKIRQATSQFRLLSRAFENSKIFANRFDLLLSPFVRYIPNDEKSFDIINSDYRISMERIFIFVGTFDLTNVPIISYDITYMYI